MSVMEAGVTARPYLHGHGPVTFSTSTTLAKPWRFVWDTNRYYADLGIPTDATRREIREAYQRLNGHDSPRLTYIVKQLLDPEVRARYDATPFGSIFFDYEVETWIRRERVRDVARLRAEGYEEAADELADTPIEAVLDTEGPTEHDAPSQPIEMVWPWAYYLWGSECQDTARLRRWQELLIAAVARRGRTLHLAIGFSGGMAHPWGVSTVGYRLVVFLDDSTQPTEALADEAASRAVSITLTSPTGQRAWR